MDRYHVKPTLQFEQQLAEIQQDPLGFGPRATRRYLSEILTRCRRLDLFPQRFTTEKVNGRTYFTFTYKAHKIFYTVDEANKSVSLITILHGSMNPELHLK